MFVCLFDCLFLAFFLLFCFHVRFLFFPACETPLGLQSGAVKDASLSASSYNDSSHMVTNARPSQSTGWCAKVESGDILVP